MTFVFITNKINGCIAKITDNYYIANVFNVKYYFYKICHVMAFDFLYIDMGL